MRNNLGFTLIELLVSMTIMAILLTMAMPNVYYYTIRGQVLEGIAYGHEIEPRIWSYYHTSGQFPSNNDALGLGSPTIMQGMYMRSLEIRNGVIKITYGSTGNQTAHKDLNGKSVYLVPSAANAHTESVKDYTGLVAVLPTAVPNPDLIPIVALFMAEFHKHLPSGTIPVVHDYVDPTDPKVYGPLKWICGTKGNIRIEYIPISCRFNISHLTQGF